MAEYVRLRAPGDHGQTLQIPPLCESNAIVDANRSLLSSYPHELQAIRSVARDELGTLAMQYSKQYSDSNVEIRDRIVMSGHQPTLFHPGVWFKNFAIDAAARSSDATAINLVVDNDLCSTTTVACPQKKGDAAELLRVPFDAAEVVLPFEMRPIKDRELFDSFGIRLASGIRDVVESPLVNSLWPEVQTAAKGLGLSAAVAAGRHRLEQKHGLCTLELPVSWMSTSESFALFVNRLATEADRFVEVHNAALSDYRKANRIRSRSHPVPELEADGPLREIPFWIWTSEDPNRRRLFVRAGNGEIELTDRVGWSVQFELSGFSTSFQELNQLDSSIFIRPRALATTMFSRLFASDLFFHGIGGAKYDQLNDQIIGKFFEIEPPRFNTTTATMKLPFEYESVTSKSITELEVQLRQMRFHPETEFPNDENAKRKKWLIENAPAGSRKAWRDEIASINEILFAKLEAKDRTTEKIMEAKSQLPMSKILGSREFSFALFPEELIESLADASS